MSITRQRDAAILMALRMARKQEPNAFRAAAIVQGVFFGPGEEPTAVERHWVKVIQTSINGPSGGDDEKEDDEED